MDTVKPIFTDEMRTRLYLLNESFKDIEHKNGIFMQVIFPRDSSKRRDHQLGAIFKFDEDNHSIIFKGYGHTLRARPEYYICEKEWRVKYLFHKLHTPLDGKKHYTPLYQIEICSNGFVYMGGEEPVPVGGSWRDDEFVYNRITQNLLCAVVRSLECS